MVQKRKRVSVVGFHEEGSLVRGIAREYGVTPQYVSTKRYGAGEWTVFTPVRIGTHAVVAGNVWEDPAKTFRLCLLLHAVREAGAKRVTLVAPWIAYGRQDRPTKPGETAAGEVIAKLLLATDVDRIVTLDAHSPRFIKFFGKKLHNILTTDAATAFARSKRIDAVAAPDFGARDRAKRVAARLHVPLIHIEKTRTAPGKVTSNLASGKPRGKRVLLVDDIADTGDTLWYAAKILGQNGALSIAAFVSHAVDLRALQSRAASRGIASLGAAFDHRSGDMRVPFTIFSPTRRT